MSDWPGLQTALSSAGGCPETELADFRSCASQLPQRWWHQGRHGQVPVRESCGRAVDRRPALEIPGRTDAELFPKHVAAALSVHDETGPPPRQ
jgi:hypothetical protein